MPTFKDPHDEAKKAERQKRYDDLVKHYERINPPDMRYLDDRGHEMPDPEPMEPPIGHVPGPDLMTIIHNMVRRVSEELKEEKQDVESFEEADEFGEEWDDEYNPVSGYENDLEPIEPLVGKNEKPKEGGADGVKGEAGGAGAEGTLDAGAPASNV